MVVERWTSSPIDILQSQRVNIGNSSLRMPSRRFRRRVIKLYSDKYELDNMVVNPTKTDEPSKKSKNSSDKYIDYEALFSQAPSKKTKTKGGAGSRSKSKSKSKSKSIFKQAWETGDDFPIRRGGKRRKKSKRTRRKKK